MVKVKYLKSHPQKQWYPAPLEVWSTDIAEWSYVQIEHICKPFMSVIYKVKFDHGRETVQVIIPLLGNFIE